MYSTWGFQNYMRSVSLYKNILFKGMFILPSLQIFQFYISPKYSYKNALEMLSVWAFLPCGAWTPEQTTIKILQNCNLL